jgi:hypothetical protein
MLNRFRLPEILFGALLTVAVFAMGMLFDSSRHPPQQTEQSSSAHQADHKSDNISEAEKADDRIARYTLWLAILTGGLVVASVVQGYFLLRSDKIARIAANAADLSAKAAIGVELPRFVLRKIVMPTLDAIPRQALQSASLYITFANHGRTAAVILAECFEWRVAKSLPDEPSYNTANTNPVDLGTVVEGAGTEYEMRWARDGLCSIGRPIEVEEENGVISGDEILWIYGFIAYRDFLQKRHMQGFCAYLEILRSLEDPDTLLRLRFVEGGPPAYTYTK